MNKIFFGLLFIFMSMLVFPQEGGKLSGQVFGDFFYTVQSDSNNAKIPNKALSGKKDSSAFQYRRINLNYDYTFNKTFFSRFRIESDQSSNTPNNRWGIFVKDAFLRWNNIFTGSDLIFGIQTTPAFEISEIAWGHRYLEKTIMDLRGIESSRDFGLSLRGRLDASGIFNYWIMAGNGSANSPEMNKNKTLNGTIYFKPSVNILMSLYADYSSRPKNTLGMNNNAFTTALFINYTDNLFYNIGLETFLQSNANDASRNVPAGLEVSTRNAFGLSLFGTYNFSSILELTMRADFFDPNANSDYKGDSRFYYIASLGYKPDPSIVIAPNILFESYENIPGRSIDPSVTARLTVSWNYH